MALKAEPFGGIIMRKVVTLGATILATLTLAACGSKSTSSSKDSSSESSSAKAESSNDITMAKYNSVKIGLPTSGNGGTSEKQVKTLFGKDTLSETEAELTGYSVKSKELTWNNVGTSLGGATVTVQFVNSKAVGKGYTDFDRGAKVSRKAYSEIQTGTSLSQVKAKLGNPTGESIVGSGPTSAQSLSYSDGSTTISLTFTNNRLVSKSTFKA